jgi:hypothetical protein
MKLLFAGASGYGNVGDDAYRYVFHRGLTPEHELRFHSPYPDTAAVAWADAVVIGGGGLIYCNHTAHFEYMKMYMDETIRQKKPLLFSSVGVQLVPPLGKTRKEILSQAEQIAPWKPYLEYAAFITTRNPLDSQLIRCVTPNIHIQAYPDLCYAFKNITHHSPSYRLVHEGARIIIPTNMSLKKHKEKYLEYLKEPAYLLALSYEDESAVAKLRDLAGLRQGLHTLSRLSPYEVVYSVLTYSSSVLTARYHGKVLAVAAGVPDIASTDSRYKSLYEPDWENPTVKAQMHLVMLKKVLT